MVVKNKLDQTFGPFGSSTGFFLFIGGLITTFFSVFGIGYDIAPTAFWLVRIFDLGFSIPLGLISVYLLWMHSNTTFPIQFMFYGFFLTMIIAVNAMGFIMFLNHDPTFLLRDLVVFIILGLIIAIGFFYILRNYKVSDSFFEK